MHIMVYVCIIYLQKCNHRSYHVCTQNINLVSLPVWSDSQCQSQWRIKADEWQSRQLSYRFCFAANLLSNCGVHTKKEFQSHHYSKTKPSSPLNTSPTAECTSEPSELDSTFVNYQSRLLVSRQTSLSDLQNNIQQPHTIIPGPSMA